MPFHVSVAPAPLNLCYVSGVDLQNDTTICPPERNVLSEVYHAAKGREWTESVNWVLPQNNHCSWHGVTCNKDNLVVGLNLPSNGLSGKLDSRISKLFSLEIVDLNDNDIKVQASCCMQPIYLQVLLCLILMMLCFLCYFSSIYCTTSPLPGQYSARNWTSIQSKIFAAVIQFIHWQGSGRA